MTGKLSYVNPMEKTALDGQRDIDFVQWNGTCIWFILLCLGDEDLDLPGPMMQWEVRISSGGQSSLSGVYILEKASGLMFLDPGR